MCSYVKATQSGHLELVDIGELLAGTPGGTDRVWPDAGELVASASTSARGGVWPATHSSTGC